MSDEAITQARQLFSSHMFTTQLSSSVLQTKPTACNATLTTPEPVVPSTKFRSFRPAEVLISSRPYLNPPTIQTRNPADTSRK